MNSSPFFTPLTIRWITADFPVALGSHYGIVYFFASSVPQNSVPKVDPGQARSGATLLTIVCSSSCSHIFPRENSYFRSRLDNFLKRFLLSDFSCFLFPQPIMGWGNGARRLTFVMEFFEGGRGELILNDSQIERNYRVFFRCNLEPFLLHKKCFLFLFTNRWRQVELWLGYDWT